MAITNPTPAGLKPKAPADLSNVMTVSPSIPSGQPSGFETKSPAVPAPGVSQFAGNAADIAANKAAYQAAHPAPAVTVQA